MGAWLAGADTGSGLGKGGARITAQAGIILLLSMIGATLLTMLVNSKSPAPKLVKSAIQGAISVMVQLTPTATPASLAIAWLMPKARVWPGSVLALFQIKRPATPDNVKTLGQQTTGAQYITTSTSTKQLRMAQVHTTHGWMVHQSPTMMVVGQPVIITGNIIVMASAISAISTVKLAMVQLKQTA